LPPPTTVVARGEQGSFARASTYLAFLTLLLTGIAGAGTSLAAGGSSGGADVAPRPAVTLVRCIATPERPCVDDLWVAAGGTVEIRGRRLVGAQSVVFYGRPGRADDAVVAPTRITPRRALRAVVPATARSGPVAVIGASGARSRRWAGLVVEDGTEAPPMPQQTGGQPAFGTRVAKRKVFFGGLRKAVFSYRLASGRPLDVTVNLIRLADGAVVQSWQQPQVGPGSVGRVVWDGRTAGKAQPEGYYTFQAVAPTAAVAAVRPSGPASADAFALYGHMFPVRGKHDFGGAAARFGAGRTGHTHQGQDVLASCGTPLVAARAGRVVYKGFHSAAGYYIVIGGSGTNQGYVYMHLRGPALVERNERVYTGQQIGEVGQTGDATACHLHFELWSAPGWYKGGRPVDPLSELQRWDGVS
jgi:murein DD-endopeptidase MepM/ murein hydrolase activator NlpD